MRLIDVDNITSGEIAKYLGRGYEFCASDIEDMLREQPTAFDVDNVVSDLEQLKLDGACSNEDCGDRKYSSKCWDGDMSEEHAIDMAIEIVKRGGRDEDYWK